MDIRRLVVFSFCCLVVFSFLSCLFMSTLLHQFMLYIQSHIRVIRLCSGHCIATNTLATRLLFFTCFPVSVVASSSVLVCLSFLCLCPFAFVVSPLSLFVRPSSFCLSSFLLHACTTVHVVLSLNPFSFQSSSFKL